MRRRKYIINKRHQYKLIASFVGATLLAITATTLSIMHDVGLQIEQQLRSSSIEITKTGDIILPVVLRSSAGVMLAYLAVLAAITAYYMLRTRHAVNGLDAGLKRLGEGDLSGELKLKDCADFGSLVSEFNEMLSVSKGRIEGVKSAAAELDEELERISEELGGKGGGGVSLDAAKAKLSRVEAALAEFETVRAEGGPGRNG